MKALVVGAALALFIPASGFAIAATPARSCKPPVRHLPECEVRGAPALVPAGALQVAQDTFGEPVEDAPIGGEAVEGEAVGNEAIGGEAVEGEAVGNEAIGGPAAEGEAVGNAPVEGAPDEGEPVEDEPIEGETVY
jgi:hypothetical protein